MSGAMRIEKRGPEEYLVGGPAEVNDCDATHDGETCNAHFNGQHISTSRPGADGAEYILARWPIESVSAAPAPLRSAEEIAREMVPDAQYESVDWRSRIQDREDYVPLEVQHAKEHAEQIVTDARALIARTVARAREEGAAATLAGQHPRDLAGCIRALVQEYAGRWADETDLFERDIILSCMGWARELLVSVREGRDVAAHIQRIRAVGSKSAKRASDELEAIVRGSAASGCWAQLGTASKVGPCYRAGLIAVLGDWVDDIAYSGGRIRVEQRRAGQRIAEWTWEGADAMRDEDGRRKVALFLRGSGHLEPGDELLREHEAQR